jgi:D-alanine transaminase
VYEVVPVYAARPFRFSEHMARLERSLQELRIANPMTPAQWLALVHRLTSEYADSEGASAHSIDQLVYLQITRGVALRDHAMPQGIAPTVFAMANRMKLPSEHDRERGVACVSAEDFRWLKAHIKSVSLLGSVLARQISVDAGAAETVMFRGGFLSEAAASNVWVVRGGEVLGPPRDNLVLQGIRYGLIEQLCREAGITFTLRRISREEVLSADEIFLSSATKEVLPVTLLDGLPVGTGRPGPVCRQLHALYQRAKEAAGK